MTHGPAQHDLRVADGVRGGDVRSDHGAVGGAADLWDLVRLGGGAGGAVAVRVLGYDPKPVHGPCGRKKTLGVNNASSGSVRTVNTNKN